MKIEMKESEDAIEQRRWELEKQRFHRKMKLVFGWSLFATFIAGLMLFLMGALIAYADPDGWPAFRVGLMTGGITAIFVVFIATIASIAYLTDN